MHPYLWGQQCREEVACCWNLSVECLIVLDGFIHAGSVHVKWKGRTLMIYVILRSPLYCETLETMFRTRCFRDTHPGKPSGDPDSSIRRSKTVNYAIYIYIYIYKSCPSSPSPRSLSYLFFFYLSSQRQDHGERSVC